jgi:hypothetical protein
MVSGQLKEQLASPALPICVPAGFLYFIGLELTVTLTPESESETDSASDFFWSRSRSRVPFVLRRPTPESLR